MSFSGVIEPEAVALLGSVFEEHCRRNGIVSEIARDSVAASLIAHYQVGMTDSDELLKAAGPRGTPPKRLEPFVTEA